MSKGVGADHSQLLLVGVSITTGTPPSVAFGHFFLLFQTRNKAKKGKQIQFIPMVKMKMSMASKCEYFLELFQRKMGGKPVF
jgi:hypothetical protein